MSTSRTFCYMSRTPNLVSCLLAPKPHHNWYCKNAPKLISGHLVQYAQITIRFCLVVRTGLLLKKRPWIVWLRILPKYPSSSQQSPRSLQILAFICAPLSGETDVHFTIFKGSQFVRDYYARKQNLSQQGLGLRCGLILGEFSIAEMELPRAPEGAFIFAWCWQFKGFVDFWRYLRLPLSI